MRCQCNTRGLLSKLEKIPPQRKIHVTSKSPVGDISDVTLIRTDTTLDHSQKAEKVCTAMSISLLSYSETRAGYVSGKEVRESKIGQGIPEPAAWPKRLPASCNRAVPATKKMMRTMRVQEVDAGCPACPVLPVRSDAMAAQPQQG